jgi:XisH protein
MAKDFFHEAVREALEADGWKITHDPYSLFTKNKAGKRITLPIDLGAERVIAAQKDAEKIAVEVKSFLMPSVINEFHKALGQYLQYRLGLADQEPERLLFLAIPEKVMEKIEDIELLIKSLNTFSVWVLIFDPEKKRVIKWQKH